MEEIVTKAMLDAALGAFEPAAGGIEQVSGTVTLDSTGPAFRQVYATGVATVQGEPLEAGQAAIFRHLAGAWQVRVMNVDGSVKDPVWRTPGAPDLRTAVTATEPTWQDDTAKGGGLWTTPTIEGVTYNPAAGTAQPGVNVTVTAATSDASKYRITGATSWTHTFPKDPTAIEWVTRTVETSFDGPAASVMYNASQLNLYPGWTDANGRLWKGSGGGASAVTVDAGLLSFEAVNGPRVVTDNVSEAAYSVRMNLTTPTGDGIVQIAREDSAAAMNQLVGIGFGTNILSFAGLNTSQITYSLAGGTTNQVSLNAIAQAGAVVLLRIDFNGTDTLSAYVNDTLILKAKLDSANATPKPHLLIRQPTAGTGPVHIQDVEVWTP